MIQLQEFFSSKSRRIFILIFQLLVCLIVVFDVTSNSFAQARQKQLQFAVDYAQFRLQKNYVHLEIYYSIGRSSLTFKRGIDGFEALANIKTYIKTADTSILVDSLIIQDIVKSLDEISPTQKFAEISLLQIKEGDYFLISTLVDLIAKTEVVYSDSISLKAFSADTLRISDIEFASAINPQQEPVTKFDKNGLCILPNATRIYGSGFPKLYFYAEAYNLQIEDKAQGSTYHLDYLIIDQSDTVITEIIGKPKLKPGRSSVTHGGLDISDLPGGTYRFKIKITDDFTGHSVAAEKNFYVYKSEDLLKAKTLIAETTVLSAEDEFMVMDEKALDNYFAHLKYIADKDELKLFNKLDLNGKRNFLLNFWANRDPDPQTAINKKKKEYLQLVDYANQEFSTNTKEGWLTDRGRVLLIYGKPQQIDREPATSDAKAYQIWYYYELEGGVEFVFVDRRDMGEYQLVHSTKRNEINDYEWKAHYVLE